MEVALALFLEKGFDVPTAEIAKAAGISEGSIFNRFATKHELFVAAMGSGLPSWAEALPALGSEQPVEDNLKHIMKMGISVFEKAMPRMMLLWSQRMAPSPMEIHAQPNSMPRRVLEGLTRYFEAEDARGRLRCPRPEIAARLIMGAVANYVFVRTIGPQAREPIPLETYVTEVVQTLINGMRATASAPGEVA